uniref:ATP synthase subunit a n=1 Tax=Pharyngomonas kirbyi TaxID=63601 RepID=A0A1W6R289_9EUKA|nr:ATP synthase F0 subunit 6 [Pharyngomonas kirbyi]ARO48005.1 ATP synthase F0 subunit 6 [Pharyngomonas kirbyi]
MFLSPFEQFKIFFLNSVDFLGITIFFSNFTLYNIIIYLIMIVLFQFFYKNMFKTNIFNSILSTYYSFTFNTLESQVSNRGKIFIPFLQFVFLFIALSNLIGMIPYNFSVTSHIAFVFGFSLMIFLGFQVTGLSLFGYEFFGFFCPSGIPLYMTPFLVLIELISYVFRVISLSIRLVANIVSGHILLKLIMGFIFNMLSKGSLFLLASACIILVMTLICLELAIALLQAYVYLVLCAIYLKDVLTIDDH